MASKQREVRGGESSIIVHTETVWDGTVSVKRLWLLCASRRHYQLIAFQGLLKECIWAVTRCFSCQEIGPLNDACVKRTKSFTTVLFRSQNDGTLWWTPWNGHDQLVHCQLVCYSAGQRQTNGQPEHIFGGVQRSTMCVFVYNAVLIAKFFIAVAQIPTLSGDRCECSVKHWTRE